MRTLIDENQLNWSNVLPGILMAFRMISSASSEFSPFYLVFGKEMNLPLDTNLIPKQDLSKNLKKHVQDVLDNLQIARTIAAENLKHTQEYQKSHYVKNTALPKFEVQDQVMLYTPKIPKGLSSKLHKQHNGPFYIVAKGLNHTYKLRRCSNNKELKSMINANRLKIYHPPDHRPDLNAPDPHIPRQDPQRLVPPNFIQPEPPDNEIQTQNQTPMQSQNAADDNTYIVSRIIRSRKRNGKSEFYIKWAGYSQRTWEPEEHIPTDMIREYFAKRTQRGTRRKRPIKNSVFK